MAQLGDSRANKKHAKALATREEEQAPRLAASLFA